VKRKLVLLGAIATASIWATAAAPFQRPASAPNIPARVPAVFPSTWRLPAGARSTFAPRAMVASDDRLASSVGTEVLKQGGNAVDAAVAVGFALAVTFP
jgi:gamma-glutamyltranspeptidase/glutathione hydrolase